MRVRVLLFGVLKELVGTAEETIEVQPGETLGSLFNQYSERFETLRNKRSSILLAKNREFARPDSVLNEDDEVAFLPPVSGGSERRYEHESGHYFAITRDPIDTPVLTRRLQRAEDGAVISFEGIVRNNSNGRSTLYLEYECYEDLALTQMAQIGTDVALTYGLGHVGIIHRLGRLNVGEASVLVVATSPHRKAAFEAALEAINRLKREVPIWKKEFFSDGEIWVDGDWDEHMRERSAPVA